MGSDDRSHAPPFPQDATWRNVSTPWTWEDLQGRVVLLVFWRAADASTIQALRDAVGLAARSDAAVAIGVHCPGMPGERRAETLDAALGRYGIETPVVHDEEGAMAEALGVGDLPAVILVDAEGRTVLGATGAGLGDPLREAVDDLVASSRDLDPSPLPGRAVDERLDPVIAHPSGLAVDDGRVAVADAGHDRVVVLDRDRNVRRVIGGTPGLEDGAFAEARLRCPHGLALDGEVLYVADTGNHAVRAIDLAEERVETVAGDGTMLRGPHRVGQGPFEKLAWPWDLCLHEERLHVAMAAAHQVWRVDPADGIADAYAGTGDAKVKDGSRQDAKFAQPTGICTDGQDLFVADALGCAIRRIEVGRGRVETLVGARIGGWGDVDGPARRARLQHPTGLAWRDGALHVADTYNHKVKRYSPAADEVVTLTGSKTPGWTDGDAGEARWDMPEAVASFDEGLLVADVAGHVIREVDDRGRTGTWTLLGVDRLAPPGQGGPVATDPVELVPGTAEIVVDVRLPDGMVLAPGVRIGKEVEAGDPDVVSPVQMTVDVETASFGVPVRTKPGRTDLAVDLGLRYCMKGRPQRVFADRIRLQVPVRVVEEGDREVRIPVAARGA